MRHAAALRIDHVMGLTRLFWIPDGATAVDGTYVRYPLEDMMGVLAQESHRARCLVVGEDLGTVPDGFRERMAAADILSYRVVWFERNVRAFHGPSRYPAQAATCVATHDLPTIAGWWTGADIDEKHALGRINENEVAQERVERAAAKEALATAIANAGAASPESIDPTRPHDAAITAAIHRFACATPSALVLFQADDLAGETTAQNLPGTDRERSNWRRKVGVGVQALWETAAGIATLAGCTARRRDRDAPG
jgi:glycogen operon protein